MKFLPLVAFLIQANLFYSFNIHTKRNNIFKKYATSNENTDTEIYSASSEPLFSVSYDPLEPPNQATFERDLEDKLMDRALRFYDKSNILKEEICYLVGLEDKSAYDAQTNAVTFTMEESLTELSELAGAAGLTVVGSTYQRVSRPSIEYYIGQGKTKEISRVMSRLKCTCVIFDTELTPSQQKNLESVLNQDRGPRDPNIKVIDRTALILDIFAQHARTKEGQLQVQLALLTYRLPRLTNMWSHLERQSAGSKGRSNGGVGLRGPGEKQLESDKREMKFKISVLNRAIDTVRRHRLSHRKRRRQLGVPVVALCGYTNAGKSSLLNALTNTADVFASDMLFATLDPTTRLVRMPGMQFPDVLLTDTVGFIQKLPTNLVAAFRATLEEIAEADVLLHVVDVTNESWRKQECAVLQELAAMGLENKPIVRVWNKIDLVHDQKEYWKFEAAKSVGTVAMSCQTGEGMKELASALQKAVCSTMEDIACVIPYSETSILSTLHNLGSLKEVLYNDEGIFVRGKLPTFLVSQVAQMTAQAWKSQQQQSEDEAADAYFYESEMSVIDEQLRKADRSEEDVHFEEEKEVLRVVNADADADADAEMFDWTDLAKGRHSAVNKFTSPTTVFTSASFSAKTALSGKNKPSITQPSISEGTPKRERGNSKTLVRNSIREFERAQTRATQQQLLTQQSDQQRQHRSEAERDELERQGLCADGLLDFDSGDFGHHAESS